MKTTNLKTLLTAFTFAVYNLSAQTLLTQEISNWNTVYQSGFFNRIKGLIRQLQTFGFGDSI